MHLAPIVVFVYNRPKHTKRTINALRSNKLASKSNLIIYSDGSKGKQDNKLVKEVRGYIKTINGFKSITIVERDQNWGLANNIVDGITQILSQHDNIIVLEDDIVTSTCFLSFMNQSMNFYKHDLRVWHISGWSYPIDFGISTEIFFSRVMNCWGWATWADRWSHYEKKPLSIINDWPTKKKNDFDLDNSGIFLSQVKANAKNKLNTWAVFWYASIYSNNGLCMNSTKSYVLNIGNDGSGINSGVSNLGNIDEKLLCKRENIKLPTCFKESKLALNAIKRFFKNNKGSILSRLNYKLRYLMKKMIRIR